MLTLFTRSLHHSLSLQHHPEDMLTFQRHVEESKEYVKHLQPLYPSNMKHVTAEKAAETVYDAQQRKAYYITSNSLVAH